MTIDPHLNLKELIVPPAGEWVWDDCWWTVARVKEGVGYCLHRGSAQALAPGDVLLAGPNPGAILRASQLGELRLEYFHVVPQLLSGLISALDWRRLEQWLRGPLPRIFHAAANSAMAKKFTHLTLLPDRESMIFRILLVQFWASGVDQFVPEHALSLAGKSHITGNFLALMSKISERELATSSPAELAAQLNCSQRHLSRLFRDEFGASLRDQQIEASLLEACHLLRNPATKIRSIASSAGYRQIGFFTAVFKRRFGMTPLEWRQHYAVTSGTEAECETERETETVTHERDAAVPPTGSRRTEATVSRSQRHCLPGAEPARKPARKDRRVTPKTNPEQEISA